MERKNEIKFVSKNDEHIILSDDEISFIFTLVVLHFQRQCEFFYYNLRFAAIKTLHKNGKYYFEVLVCPKSVLQWEILI